MQWLWNLYLLINIKPSTAAGSSNTQKRLLDWYFFQSYTSLQYRLFLVHWYWRDVYECYSSIPVGVFSTKVFLFLKMKSLNSYFLGTKRKIPAKIAGNFQENGIFKMVIFYLKTIIFDFFLRLRGSF